MVRSALEQGSLLDRCRTPYSIGHVIAPCQSSIVMVSLTGCSANLLVFGITLLSGQVFLRVQEHEWYRMLSRVFSFPSLS